MVEIATGAPLKSKKNPAAVALGKLGGRVGGKARAEKLAGLTDHIWSLEDLVGLLDKQTIQVAA